MFDTQTSKQQQAYQSDSQKQFGSEFDENRNQSNSESSNSRQQQNDYPINIMELSLRGTNALFDIHLTALRGLWQIQAQSISAFSALDYSDLFRAADIGTKRVMSSSSEQLISSARQVSDTVNQLQRQFSRVMEQGTLRLSEDVRRNIQEFNQRSQESLDEVRNIVQRGEDQMLNGQQNNQQNNVQSSNNQSTDGSQRDNEKQNEVRNQLGKQNGDKDKVLANAQKGVAQPNIQHSPQTEQQQSNGTPDQVGKQSGSPHDAKSNQQSHLGGSQSK